MFFKLVLKGFKLKKLGVEPKNGSTGQPVVLVRSSTGQGRPKSFSLSQWPSLPPVKVILFPVEVRSRTDRGPIEAQRSPAKHLMLKASQPVEPPNG